MTESSRIKFAKRQSRAESAEYPNEGLDTAILPIYGASKPITVFGELDAIHPVDLHSVS